MRIITLLASLAIAITFAPSTLGHGFCAHEKVHTYGSGGGASVVVLGSGTGAGSVTVTDSETADCNGNGIANDLDGDFDVGSGGGLFGHGPWAEHCGLHQEVVGTVTVTDLVFGLTVAFVTGSDDQQSWVPDPTTGENTCITDGVISPGTDADDCLSAHGTGTQVVVCPGGGDGGLWVVLDNSVSPRQVSNPPTSGTISSP